MVYVVSKQYIFAIPYYISYGSSEWQSPVFTSITTFFVRFLRYFREKIIGKKPHSALVLYMELYGALRQVDKVKTVNRKFVLP